MNFIYRLAACREAASSISCAGAGGEIRTFGALQAPARDAGRGSESVGPDAGRAGCAPRATTALHLLRRARRATNRRHRVLCDHEGAWCRSRREIPSTHHKAAESTADLNDGESSSGARIASARSIGICFTAISAALNRTRITSAKPSRWQASSRRS
jgi:hypothetical protein